MQNSLWILLVSTFSIAFLHALAPDHWMPFAVVILGPCEPLIPLAFLGYNYGWPGVIGVSIVFSAVTIFMMLAQSLLALMGIQLIKGHIVERYSHAFAGLVIALTGVFVMVAGV
jgi:hypothetical protein